MEYCSDSNGKIIYKKNKFNCLADGSSWTTHDWNFDNIINALITLYVAAFLDNWQTIMFSASDISDINSGSIYRSNPAIYIYLIKLGS